MPERTTLPERLRVSARETLRLPESRADGTFDNRREFAPFADIFAFRPGYLLASATHAFLSPSERRVRQSRECEMWQPTRDVLGLRETGKEHQTLERCEDAFGLLVDRNGVPRCCAFAEGYHASDFPHLAASAMLRESLRLAKHLAAWEGAALAHALQTRAQELALHFSSEHIAQELARKKTQVAGNKAWEDYIDEKLHNLCKKQDSASTTLLCILIGDTHIEPMSVGDGGYFILDSDGNVVVAYGELQFDAPEQYQFGSHCPDGHAPQHRVHRIARMPGMHLAAFTDGLLKGRYETAEEIAREVGKRVRGGTPFRQAMADVYFAITSLDDKTLWAIDLE